MHIKRDQLMKLLIYPSLIILFSACASLVNEPTLRIKIRSNKPATLKIKNQEYEVSPGKKVKIDVERSKEPLKIIVQQDSSKKIFYLKPQNSFYY